VRGIVADVSLDELATLVEMDGENDTVHLLIHNALLSALSFPDLKDGACRAF